MSSLTFQPADDLHTWPREYVFLVRRVGQFSGQILPGEVKILVQVQTPFGAIGHIVDDAVVRDKFSGAALAVLAAQFEVRNDAVLIIHAGIIQAIQKE